tara:strand:- start:163 stop:675 length:513 start_codon:yes stop_codon:yes gene_type:complete
MTKPLLYLVFSLLLSSHDFHITHTSLRYNSNLESIEITMKVSIEDLERSLERNSSEKLRIGTIKENKLAKKIITNYFNNHLRIFTNDKLSQFQWVGKEIDNNLHDIYLYFEIPNCNKNGEIQFLTLENTIFLETELQQTNIVLVEFKDHKFNLTFTKDQDNQRIKLDKML